MREQSNNINPMSRASYVQNAPTTLQPCLEYVDGYSLGKMRHDADEKRDRDRTGEDRQEGDTTYSHMYTQTIVPDDSLRIYLHEIFMENWGETCKFYMCAVIST